MNKFYPDLKFPTAERELIALKGKYQKQLKN
jgi:hypothetical protein